MNPPNAEASFDPAFRRERNRRAMLSTGSALGARGVALVLSLLTVPLTLNHLGVERYGMWVTISSMIAILSLTDLGIGLGLMNALSRALALGDRGSARIAVSSATVLLIALSLVAGVVFAIAFPFVMWPQLFAVTSQEAANEAGPAIAIFVAVFLLGLPLTVAAQSRVARQELYVVHIAAALGSVASLAALLVVINTGGGVPALVLAMTVPPVIATAINALILFRRDAPDLRPTPGSARLGVGIDLIRSGFLFLVLQLSMLLAFATDTLVITHTIGPEAVAEYGVVSTLFMIPMGLVAVAVAPLWPAYGEAITRGDMEWTKSTLRRSVLVALAVTIPFSIVLIGLGRPIVGFWTDGAIDPAIALLAGFGLWTVQGSVGRAIAMFLNGANEIRAQAIAGVAMAISNLALSIWLTARFGVSGAIWGTVITYGLFVLIPMAVYVPPVIRKLGRLSS